jgi:SAM-dependent methyltransferase
VDEDERLRRRSAFGTVARAYAEHRPGYPADAVRWALNGRSPAGLRVLDLGAGTGKLTEALLRLGAQVTAVEPDGDMLGELRRLFPRARALAGSAEAIPLPDGSVDAVACGQAMHWFDMPRAIPEIARVLAGGGSLAGLWNTDDDRVEWVARLQEVSREAAAPSVTGSRAEAARLGTGQFGGDFFGPVERAEFPHQQVHTAASLIALSGTHSRVLALPPAEREALLREVAGFLASWPQTSSGEFTLPMVTAVVRSVRRRQPGM